MNSTRVERFEKLSFLQRLNLRVFGKHCRLFFFQDSFFARGFQSFLYENIQVPPVRIVNDSKVANTLILYDSISVKNKEYVEKLYQQIQEPKFVVLITGTRVGKENKFECLNIADMMSVDLEISQYAGYQELLTKVQRLEKEVP